MMLRLIGRKRVIALSIMLAINVALACTLFFYVEPLRAKAVARKQAVDREIRDLTSSIRNIKDKIKSLEENQAAFDTLKENQFLVEQNRFLVEKTLENMRAWTRVIGFSYAISAIEDVENPKASEVKQRLVRSTVNVNQVRAHLDSDVYRFVQQIDNKFPGQTQIKSVSIQRGDDLTPENLARVSTGTPVGFIEGNITFDWYTVIDLPEDDTAKPGGRR